MKKALLIILNLVIVNTLFSNDFQKANVEFSTGNYKKAIELYKSDISNNGDSFSTLYNIGNAYYKENKKGLALYYLNKAYLVNPRDRDLNQSINIIEKELSIKKSIKLLKLPLSPREIQLLSTISLLSLGVVLFLVTLFRFLDSKSNWFYKIRSTFIITTASVTFILLTLNIYNITNKKWGIVKVPAKAHISPYHESDESFSITEGSPVKIEEKFQDFYFITDSEKRYGWIDIDSVGNFWKE